MELKKSKSIISVENSIKKEKIIQENQLNIKQWRMSFWRWHWVRSMNDVNRHDKKHIFCMWENTEGPSWGKSLMNMRKELGTRIRPVALCVGLPWVLKAQWFCHSVLGWGVAVQADSSTQLQARSCSFMTAHVHYLLQILIYYRHSMNAYLTKGHRLWWRVPEEQIFNWYKSKNLVKILFSSCQGTTNQLSGRQSSSFRRIARTKQFNPSTNKRINLTEWKQ